MGMDTVSAQFFNADGDAMFKIFVGRDESRRLKADQVERFARLGSKVRRGGARNLNRRLKVRPVLIFGASRGVGLALARLLRRLTSRSPPCCARRRRAPI